MLSFRIIKKESELQLVTSHDGNVLDLTLGGSAPADSVEEED